MTTHDVGCQDQLKSDFNFDLLVIRFHQKF